MLLHCRIAVATTCHRSRLRAITPMFSAGRFNVSCLSVARAATLAIFAATLATPQAHAASGYLYDCDMTDVQQGRGWISPKIVLVFTGDGTVTVIDAVTMNFSRDPIHGTILRDNAQRLIVKWTIKDARADSGHSFANFDYRASIAKASGKMALTAIPRSFDTGVQGTGACRKRTE